MNDNMEFKFSGSVKFIDGKMITSYDILDGDTVVSSFANTIDCDIEEPVVAAAPKQTGLFARMFKANESQDTFSSGIWTILLKDVLKTVGGVLVAQIKKKIEKKIKKKFGQPNAIYTNVPAGQDVAVTPSSPES